MKQTQFFFAAMLFTTLNITGCAEHVQLKNVSLGLADVRQEIKTRDGSTRRVSQNTHLIFRFSLDDSLKNHKDARNMLWAECNVISNGTSIAYSWPEGPFEIIDNKVVPDSLAGPNYATFVFRGLNAYSEANLTPTPLKDLAFDRIDCQFKYLPMAPAPRILSNVVSYSREEVLKAMAQPSQVISAKE